MFEGIVLLKDEATGKQRVLQSATKHESTFFKTVSQFRRAVVVISVYSSVSFGFWLKTAASVFHGFGFSTHKTYIALHITFVENDQTCYFASNHTPDRQHCYVRL